MSHKKKHGRLSVFIYKIKYRKVENDTEGTDDDQNADLIKEIRNENMMYTINIIINTIFYKHNIKMIYEIDIL